MMHFYTRFGWLSVVILGTSIAAAKADDQTITVSKGKLTLIAPEKWERKKPSSNIVEHEFSVPASEGDENDGRVTVMGAGGTVQANIDRWIGQFTQPDGSETKDRTKTQKVKVGGREVHVIDISGTYKDQRGPFSQAPAVQREKYRMLAAIIADKELGNYFIKFYGPQQTVADNEKAFMSMIDSLKVK
jgi:hypothetical protein